MNGRRRNPRFHVSRAFEGSLQTFNDVVIDCCDGPYVVVLSDIGLRPGLALSLDVFAGSTRRTLPVTVVESVPVIHGGLLRYRLRLSAAGSSGGIESDGLLAIDTPVRVLDISENGCLFEAGRQTEIGTVGLARLDIDGGAYEGAVRVVRCSRIEGAAELHHLGAEFLRTGRVPHGSALRHAFVTLLKTLSA